MPNYRVQFNNTCSIILDVEADSVEDAIEKAQESEDMPGGITVGAFGCQSFDGPNVDDDEWNAAYVEDADTNKVVWMDKYS